ncbi:ABC transporter ATP-binding protein [Frigidibacter sp. RF13]|uniref:ABC transporter ATP-binding protein n=1 Tax=Frigidibacter sp. RF13 TaxID=2997340 RepID=UPI00226FA0DB|nr:ABC transporter ATP-binding protein [Frigidibacter sp. RF13]MCY1127480.1 ABC transporter ATP-binding protein [Frigidibacter sp. RF13]
MLEVEGLSVRYGAVEAVGSLGFTVPKGSITVLLGANGAGKSSTLNAISGLAPSRGRIILNGAEIGGLPPEEIVRRGIALCPEGRRVFPSLSVADNLHLGGAVHAKGDELASRTEAELDRFPILRERYHQKAGLLSGGEQQMLALARALMSAPRLLLLDEPSLGLAPKVVDQIFDLIAGLRSQGITILLVEQNAERALEIADHGYVLQSGALALSGSGRELAESPLIREAYLAG